MLDKDGSSLELAMLIPVKIRDPFVRIRKKIGPKLNRKSRRKSVVATIEEGALAQKKKAPTPPPGKGGEKVLRRRGQQSLPYKIQKEEANPLLQTVPGFRARYLSERMPTRRGDWCFSLSWTQSR